MAKKLANYIRTHRRRAGLSQAELAFLVGSRAKGGSVVSRYERYDRLPPLPNAVALLVAFDASPRDLFAGVHDRIERETRRRASRLLRKLAALPQTPVVKRKVRHLQEIVRTKR